jgi:hypothetical protein
MESERSDRIMEPSSRVNPTGDERAVPVKPFDIPKRLVVDAWRLVRANRGAAGVDGETLEAFERDLKKNLYRIWNRMSSGSYFPAPVKEVLIPKEERWQTTARDSDRFGPRGADGREARARTRTGATLPRGLLRVPTGKVSSSSNCDHPRALLATQLGA